MNPRHISIILTSTSSLLLCYRLAVCWSLAMTWFQERADYTARRFIHSRLLWVGSYLPLSDLLPRQHYWDPDEAAFPNYRQRYCLQLSRYREHASRRMRRYKFALSQRHRFVVQQPYPTRHGPLRSLQTAFNLARQVFRPRAWRCKGRQRLEPMQ